jgi:glycerol-3-phosphate acyltransferase PlsX
MRPAFKSFKQSLDYAEYGGAPLLGINGVCIICHGGSSPKAIMNAILVAVDMVRKQVNKVIQEKLKENGNAIEQIAKKENKVSQ